MKWLYLTRHADAKSAEEGQHDSERQLSPLGERQAESMGNCLQSEHCQIDLLLSSPAQRTLQTANILANAIAYPAAQIIINPDIYNATLPTLLEVIQHLNPQVDKVMIVGHNPGMSNLANTLCKRVVEMLPTCGIVQLAFDAPQWEDCTKNKQAQLLNFFIPEL